MIIAILGRQPRIGLAELESLYGAVHVSPLGDHAATINAEVEPARLGSVLKIAKPLQELAFTDWRKITRHIIDSLPEHLANLPEGKVKIGLSAYGLPVTAQHLFRTGLEIKKAARADKRSVRVVPSNDTAVNSAQVLHNGLTGELGMELLFIRHGNKTTIAQTSWVQDIDDYARRDYGRPRRDAFVGMLPPKLAQTMLNLAQVRPGEQVLDPFCGTGVVLQEAALLGCPVYGTDASEKMVRYTRDNLHWLDEIYLRRTQPYLEVLDAASATWRAPLEHIVCETYLGQPLSGLPKPDKLAEIIRDCDTIISKFLKNVHPQLQPNTRHTIAVPAWRANSTFKHLPLLDRLEALGYNRVRFTHAPTEGDLLYHREDQIVARELLVLTVK
ncbi:MAG TPA: DNA methyltransferase [Candidatus Saccharimonadales bacterium]|nr:DNA methyltransferase [Candidatus Saccharimonadales bacterium]